MQVPTRAWGGGWQTHFCARLELSLLQCSKSISWFLNVKTRFCCCPPPPPPPYFCCPKPVHANDAISSASLINIKDNFFLLAKWRISHDGWFATGESNRVHFSSWHLIHLALSSQGIKLKALISWCYWKVIKFRTSVPLLLKQSFKSPGCEEAEKKGRGEKNWTFCLRAFSSNGHKPF